MSEGLDNSTSHPFQLNSQSQPRTQNNMAFSQKVCGLTELYRPKTGYSDIE